MKDMVYCCAVCDAGMVLHVAQNNHLFHATSIINCIYTRLHFTCQSQLTLYKYVAPHIHFQQLTRQPPEKYFLLADHVNGPPCVMGCVSVYLECWCIVLNAYMGPADF